MSAGRFVATAGGADPPTGRRRLRSVPTARDEPGVRPEPGTLRVLVVDDEPPALADLVHLLRDDPRVGTVEGVGDATGALLLVDRAIEAGEPVDALFVDMRMPGLTGLDLARTLVNFTDPPAVVFVTAYEAHRAEAFDHGAVDYLLKPVRPERLAGAVDRVLRVLRRPGPDQQGDDEVIAADEDGVTRLVRVAEVRYVTAQGEKSLLHTGDGAFPVRVRLDALAQRWATAGFVRAHDDHLLAVRHIASVRMDTDGMTVEVAGTELPVGEGYARHVREALVRRDPR